MWGQPTFPGTYAPRYVGSLSLSSFRVVLCAHRHIRRVPHQWNKSRDTSSPGNKNSVGRELVRVKCSLPRPEFGWFPAHLGLPHLFSRPACRRKKLTTQRKSLSRLTTTRGRKKHERRLNPFPPRKSLSTDEFPQHGERNKQPDRPEHLLSTAYSLSLEPQVSRASAPQNCDVLRFA